MGRELRRVPLDFDWPLNKVWEGFLNPHATPCPACLGRGNTTAREYLEHLASLLLLLGEAAGTGRLHPWLSELPLAPNGAVSPDAVELSTGLAGRAPRGGMGHDALDRWRATQRIIEAAGLNPDTWGQCAPCVGTGQDPATAAAAEAWRPTEPPTGEGYQLWETTSDGSPVGPVFESLDDLCAWAESNATTFGPHRATATDWHRMLTEDFVHHREGNQVFI